MYTEAYNYLQKEMTVYLAESIKCLIENVSFIIFWPFLHTLSLRCPPVAVRPGPALQWGPWSRLHPPWGSAGLTSWSPALPNLRAHFHLSVSWRHECLPWFTIPPHTQVSSWNWTGLKTWVLWGPRCCVLLRPTLLQGSQPFLPSSGLVPTWPVTMSSLTPNYVHVSATTS